MNQPTQLWSDKGQLVPQVLAEEPVELQRTHTLQCGTGKDFFFQKLENTQGLPAARGGPAHDLEYCQMAADMGHLLYLGSVRTEFSRRAQFK